MTKTFQLGSLFWAFYFGRAKDIDNDNNNRFYKRNTQQKRLIYKKQINHNEPVLML
jgi:hypothetical protein